MSLAPLHVTQLQSLWVEPSQHPRGLGYLSAASGLVRVRQRLYVVADDELHLGVFDDGQPVGALLRLLDGDLPKDAGKRKKAKPDFETLVHLAPLPGYPAGALLTLGSGSRPNRETGVLIALDTEGTPSAQMSVIDLAPLYAPLRQQFPDLNIEGLLLVSGDLLLLHRGNKGDGRSACIRYDWHLLAPWLGGLAHQPPAAKRIDVLQLPDAQGVPLGFTDGTALQGGAWAFCAVAEATDDSYVDGACVASAIGVVGDDGQLAHLQWLQGAPKVEGIAAQLAGDDWVFTLVTDPDDPKVAAHMLQTRLPRDL